MGRGSLKRIAALTTTATMSVMVAGAVNVLALPALPSTPQVTTTVPTTVPSTSVTVPSTPVTPQTTVTTPTVTTPKVQPPAPAPPKVSAPKVSAPAVKTPAVKAPTLTQESSPTSSGGGGGGSTLQKQTGAAIDTVGGLTQSGTSGAVSGTKDRAGGATGGGLLTGSGAGAGGSSARNALTALGFFGGPSGPGGSSGAGGTSGPGGGIFGSGRGGRGGGLPPTLSAAGASQLRSALELLEGCMSAIAPIDRRVLGMRAGGPGTAPLSRSQVAARLGVSTRQVRRSERRGLSGLRTAAEQTGCAGAVGGPFAVSGIGPLPLIAPGALAAAPGDGGGGSYVPARQAQPGGASPLAGLGGSGQSGPAWLVVLFTVLFSVSIAGLMRELRSSVGA